MNILNKINKYNKIINILIIVVSMTICIRGVRSADATFGSSLGGHENSGSCSGNTLCATDVEGSGFKISIVDSSGTTLKKNGKDLFAIFYPTCTLQSKKKVPNCVKSDKIGLPDDIDSDNYAQKYSNYFTDVNLTNNIDVIIKNILIKNGFNNVPSSNYYMDYLKFEPYYEVKENVYGNISYFEGTNQEILSSFGKKIDLSVNTVKKLDNLNSFGFYYVNGGQGSYIHNKINFIRNYTVSIYTKCFNDLSHQETFYRSGTGFCNNLDIDNYKAENHNLDDYPKDYTEEGSLPKNLVKVTNSLNSYARNGNGLSVGYVKIIDYLTPTFTIEGNKVSSVGNSPINGKKYTLELYNTGNCTGTVIQTQSFDTSSFKFTGIENAGTYSIREIATPGGKYEMPSDNCVVKNIELSGDPHIVDVGQIVNTPGCVMEFDEIKASNGSVSLQERWNLYNKYLDKGDYRALLDSSKTRGVEACKKVNSPSIPEAECMGFNVGNIGNFYYSDVSQYNLSHFDKEVTDDDGNTTLCKIIKISLNQTEDVKNSPKQDTKFITERGRALFDNVTDAIKADYDYMCIRINENSPVLSQDDVAKDVLELVTNVSLKYAPIDGMPGGGIEELEANMKSAGSSISDFKEHKLYQYVVSGFYQFKDVDVTLFSGVKSKTGETSFTLKGKGVVTSKLDKVSQDDVCKSNGSPESGDLQFSLTYNGTEYSHVCPYTLTDTFWKKDCSDGDKPKVNVEFRVIDTTNPFPGKSGTGRIFGSNWRGYCILDGENLAFGDLCDFNANKTLMLIDINKDGKILDSEKTLLDSYKNGLTVSEFEGIDLSRFDSAMSRFALLALKGLEPTLIKTFIEDKPNSYGRKNNNKDAVDKPKYEITLTPADIKNIRKYNNKTTYNDGDQEAKGYCIAGSNACDTYKSYFVQNLIGGKIGDRDNTIATDASKLIAN